MKEYSEKYGSEQYGRTAYYIDKIGSSTLGVWIITICIGIYLKNKNLKLSKIIKVIAIVMLVITQLLPLGYAIFVKNQRSLTNTVTNHITNDEYVILRE